MTRRPIHDRSETILGAVLGVLAFGAVFVVVTVFALVVFSWGITGHTTPDTWLSHPLGLMIAPVILALVAVVLIAAVVWAVAAIWRR